MKWSEISLRERDALVAEHVMGWTKIGYDNDIMCEDWFGFESGNEDDPNGYWPVARYTTDISAAWEVVEKLRADGWHMELYNDYWVRELPLQYGCDFRNDGRFCHAYSRTASEAICLTALKAVGVDVEVSNE